jgi:glycosyltransferase involved in cell wall biosynthesis
MTIKVAAVSMVKNECDIIELFLRINSKHFDHFFLLDHYSTDDTVQIIKNMQYEGFPITWIPLFDQAYNQADIMTNAVREVAKLNDFDYIMPIDADEFIHTELLDGFSKELAKSVSSRGLGVIPWVTYCPVHVNYFDSPSPLFENFRRRAFEPRQYHKVVMGNDFARHCKISMGNHAANNYRYKTVPYFLRQVQLQHVPVRSNEQIVRKAILSSYAASIKKNRKKGECFHWDLMAQQIKNNNYRLSDCKLFEFGISYATKEHNRSSNWVIDDGMRVGTEGDVIRYVELSKIQLLASFDAELGRLTSQLIGRRGFILGFLRNGLARFDKPLRRIYRDRLNQHSAD